MVGSLPSALQQGCVRACVSVWLCCLSLSLLECGGGAWASCCCLFVTLSLRTFAIAPVIAGRGLDACVTLMMRPRMLRVERNVRLIVII